MMLLSRTQRLFHNRPLSLATRILRCKHSDNQDQNKSYNELYQDIFQNYSDFETKEVKQKEHIRKEYDPDETTQKYLTHTNEKGQLNMVDVGSKPDSVRMASAKSRIFLGSQTFNLVKNNDIQKGDVLTVAKIAGIIAAKKTSELIPLCHPIALNKVAVDFELNQDENAVYIYCTARTNGKTGVEMEALTGASVAALTIYDMCKAVNREMVIDETRLLKKSGGMRGDYEFDDHAH